MEKARVWKLLQDGIGTIKTQVTLEAEAVKFGECC